GADARNQANLRNASERQRVSDTNALLRQETAADNLNRRNDLASRRADYRLNKTAGVTGQLGTLARRDDAEKDALQRNLSTVARGFGRAADGAMTFGMSGNSSLRGLFG